ADESAVRRSPFAESEHPPPISPVVRRIAAEHNLDLAEVKGTGRRGRVTKKDVLAYLENGHEKPAEAPLHIESPYREEEVPRTANGERRTDGEPLSPMRAQIAQHMRRSLDTAAHCTTIVEADMSRVEEARGR